MDKVTQGFVSIDIYLLFKTQETSVVLRYWNDKARERHRDHTEPGWRVGGLADFVGDLENKLEG